MCFGSSEVSVSILLLFMEAEASQSSGSMESAPRDIISMAAKRKDAPLFFYSVLQ